MSEMDKDLLEKFARIRSKQKSYDQQNQDFKSSQENRNSLNFKDNQEFKSSQDFKNVQDQSSEDEEPISIASSVYSTTESTNRNSCLITKSNSSLSHSSSNASSTSEPIQRKQQTNSSNKNLKNQLLINSFNNQNGLNDHPNNHANNQINHSNKANHNIVINNQTNNQTNNETSNYQINSPFKGSKRALIEKTKSSSSAISDKQNEQQITKLDQTESIQLINSNLIDLTIPPIDMTNLANLAKNPSDSNLSDSNFSGSVQSDSNDTMNDKEEEDEDLITTNPFTNIKLNPFVQQDQKSKNLFKAAKEIRDSEKNYIDALSIICVQYKSAVQKTINQTVLDQLLQPLNTILQLNSVLLSRFNHCIKNWDQKNQSNQKIANVLVELGPFLKHYADFATKFEQINLNYTEIKRKHPAFKEATELFEKEDICRNLTIGHYMLKPIQRIGQYKLLIEKYIKYLKTHLRHPDYENAIKALHVVTIAAEYTNEKMRENENFAKLLTIQQRITNGVEIIKPHRRLIKQSILHKISRKVKQERLFILCSDCLIYLTIAKEGSYKVNHEMSLIGMRVTSSEQQAFQNEILIRSSQRSIRVVASSLAEKEDWMNEINKQIQSNMRRRSTLRSDAESLLNGQCNFAYGPMCLGEEAPIWTPDERVSMCQICGIPFNHFNRRHHCRACGKVVCGKCSKQNHYLIYARRKERVCDNCFDTLTKHAIPEEQDENNQDENNLKNQSQLSTSDPTLNHHHHAQLEERLNLNSNLSSIYKKVRRNSSNLTTFSSRSSRSSMFFVEDEQMNRDKNEEILSLLEEPNSLDEQQIEMNTKQQNEMNKITSNRIERSTSLNEQQEPATPQIEQQHFNRLNLRQSGRKRIPKVLTEISADDKESDMSGYMLKKKGKKTWRKFWFVLKSHVIYSFKQSEDVIAMQSMPILGYNVQISQISLDGQPANLILELTHQNLPTEHFRLDTDIEVEKWLKALRNATTV